MISSIYWYGYVWVKGLIHAELPVYRQSPDKQHAACSGDMMLS